MSDIDALELDALWEEFHRLVNMTSQELSTWLRTEAASENAEQLPEHAGTATGQHVLGILRKRRTDLTDDDIKVMYAIVDTVGAQRRDDLEPQAGDAAWRHRLMSLGHDPLKPPE
ncbi:DUF3140 domain-containing protein [Streptomyces sp. NPDC006692]|uniref:DUF3140 domain-containing protein n=1 Tax=unclassified Streptomyces TaxID=2593676 RepID=UPI0036A309E1